MTIKIIMIIIVTNFLPHGDGGDDDDTQSYSNDEEESVPCHPLHVLASLSAFTVLISKPPLIFCVVSIVHDVDPTQ